MKFNSNEKIEFVGHPSYKEHFTKGCIIPPTVYVYFDFGITAGGFHVDLKSAKDLRTELDKAIELAGAPK